jgi:hypothetical protein
MERLVACSLLVLVALGSSSGQGKSRKGGSLSKRQCEEICVQMTKCLGLPADKSSTTVETLICADDCVVESKDKERRPGWLCASRAVGCEDLKACNPGGRAETPK